MPKLERLALSGIKTSFVLIKIVVWKPDNKLTNEESKLWIYGNHILLRVGTHFQVKGQIVEQMLLGKVGMCKKK